MKLLVIRHAIAMDAEEFADTGETDDRRPLTNYGAKRMRKNAKGLRTLIDRIDRFATSPLTRPRCASSSRTPTIRSSRTPGTV